MVCGHLQGLAHSYNVRISEHSARDAQRRQTYISTRAVTVVQTCF